MNNSRDNVDERTHLLAIQRDGVGDVMNDVESAVFSPIIKDNVSSHTLASTKLPYSDYTTINLLHDLVKDSCHHQIVHSRKGIRYALLATFDSCQGWIAAAIIGIITASVAAVVDIAVPTVSDWKTGYCQTNVLSNRDLCCTKKSSVLNALDDSGEICIHWHHWSHQYWHSFYIYVGFALLFGTISGSVTLLTKTSLPAAAPGISPRSPSREHGNLSTPKITGKTMYMAAGSGIPELKSILSGFDIPHFLDFKVLVIKAIGSIFAVPTGLPLGKEGPFVHISGCAAYLVANFFPKHRNNSRRLREMLAVGSAAGLSVAFGAPLGGILFAYEEIATYFPRKVLLRAFACSLSAAIVLRALNPTGTGRLVLFETNFRSTYKATHYIFFTLLGLAGGVFGGIFCKANFLWSRKFRSFHIIKQHPVFEVFLVVLATAVLQYLSPLTQETGDVIIKNVLIDCRPGITHSYVCQQEAYIHHHGKASLQYIGHLIYGTLVKLVLTIITFGTKVPGGVIIPALDGGAFFGRLVGQLPFLASSISPGVFALVGAGAFLAGVSRMTISLVVILFELTGELEFVVPSMIAVMVAKWVADSIEKGGVYDIAQIVLGHPFLDLDYSMTLVQRYRHLVSEFNAPNDTMHQIMVEIPPSGCVSKVLLVEKLEQFKIRGLMDAGLVLVHPDRNGMLAGYLTEEELELGLTDLGEDRKHNEFIRLWRPKDTVPPSDAGFGHEEELDLSHFVDRTPLTISEDAPMEYAVEMFGKLGLRYLIITESVSGGVSGVITKKSLLVWLEELKHASK